MNIFLHGNRTMAPYQPRNTSFPSAQIFKNSISTISSHCGLWPYEAISSPTCSQKHKHRRNSRDQIRSRMPRQPWVAMKASYSAYVIRGSLSSRRYSLISPATLCGLPSPPNATSSPATVSVPRRYNFYQRATLCGLPSPPNINAPLPIPKSEPQSILSPILPRNTMGTARVVIYHLLLPGVIWNTPTRVLRGHTYGVPASFRDFQ